ncbi:MAG TPA: DinB family protein [Vicinamibacteria bacterium]|nr:DinB family protein [Vicinamibacteria bacterium]
MKEKTMAAEPVAPEHVRELLAAWRTNDRATIFLVRRLPKDVWPSPIPGVPRLTVRMIAAHIHNARCGWIRSLGERDGIEPPARVDRRRVGRAELARALSRSSRGIADLIRLGASRGGRVPRATWQNFPTDLAHFLSYFVAHEAHHRGQLIMICHQLGRRLPSAVADGVWQWTRLARE